jgi:hypothetical protein
MAAAVVQGPEAFVKAVLARVASLLEMPAKVSTEPFRRQPYKR